jgi:oxalate decarboxylase family bicupin protein
LCYLTAYRELHWHSASEWAYIINGTFRVAAIDEDGKNQVSDVGPGDLWFFAAGRPHSIQSISKGGGEFLLAFDNGSFSEDDTLLLSDFVSHIPREVLVKNFPGMDNSDFNHAPGSELYIFPGDAPAASDSQQVSDPQGGINASSSISYKFSEVKPTQLNGGTVKIVDSRSFPASTDIAAAEVTIEPGAMRELHWHPTGESQRCPPLIALLAYQPHFLPLQMNGTFS